MRSFLAILIIALGALIAEHYFVWWSMVPVAFLVMLFLKMAPGRAFIVSFISIALLWLTISLLKDIPNHHILSARMAMLFHLPNYALFLLVTSVIGGLVGGLAGWCGSSIRRLF